MAKEGVEMDATYERIAQHLRSTPPSCVRNFRLIPAELPVNWDDSCKSVWRLSCSCGGEQGRVLGFPRRECNKDYDGPECFLSPLSFECMACGEVAEIIDTDKHGYHSEVAKRDGGIGSVKYRGQGQPESFPCPACQGNVFEVTVGFVYWPACFDLFLEEPELPCEDFFIVFLSYGRCVACRQLSVLTDFGKL